MKAQAPLEFTDQILKHCAKLSDKKPLFIPVTPVRGAVAGECFGNVLNHIERDKHGGTIVYGYAIYAIPRVWVEFEHHAVWKDPKGQIQEITPRTDESVTAFLECSESTIEYNGYRRPNIRFSLGHPRAMELIRLHKEYFNAMYKNQIPYSKAVTCNPKEVNKCVRKVNKVSNAIKRSYKTLPDDPCTCYSRKRYADCCGKF